MITHVSEENRQSLEAQLVPECCSMRNLDRNQPAAGSSSISEKNQGAENAFSAVRLLQSRDQRNLTCVPNCICNLSRSTIAAQIATKLVSCDTGFNKSAYVDAV